MRHHSQRQAVVGMNVGSASLVMVFSVLCLTIFAVLSVVTARSEWNLAGKTADAVTAYYAADSAAVDILDQVAAQYNGNFLLPDDCSAQLEEIDGVTHLNYYVPIDSNQVLWVQLCHDSEAIQVTRWEVNSSGAWTADDSLNIWGG